MIKIYIETEHPMEQYTTEADPGVISENPGLEIGKEASLVKQGTSEEEVCLENIIQKEVSGIDPEAKDIEDMKVTKR